MDAASHSTGCTGMTVLAVAGARNRRRNSTGTSEMSALPRQLMRATPSTVVAEVARRSAGSAGRVELALLGDRVDRGLVVGVIAQPQPGVPALDAVVPGHVEARIGRADLVDGGHPPIVPGRCKADAVTSENYDLIIVGAGSGNSIINDEMDGWRIAIVERWTFGGTCLNRGCVPSKMFIYAADVAESAAHDNATSYGVTTRFESADWRAIVQRIFGRIDPIAEGGRLYRHELANVTVYEGDANFVGERTLEVDGAVITGDRIVIATGARSFVPDIHGIDEVPFDTSDTIMRIAHVPKHLVVLGGGFIAAEMSHVFRSFGAHVTIVNRSHRLLCAEDHDVSKRFTELAHERFDLVLGAKVDARLHDRDGDRPAHHNRRR